jgi:hypothetical protein
MTVCTKPPCPQGFSSVRLPHPLAARHAKSRLQSLWRIDPASSTPSATCRGSTSRRSVVNLTRRGVQTRTERPD